MNVKSNCLVLLMGYFGWAFNGLFKMEFESLFSKIFLTLKGVLLLPMCFHISIFQSNFKNKNFNVFN